MGKAQSTADRRANSRWSEHPEIAVAHHLAAHDGVITTGQALACGLTVGQIRSQVERGLWIRQAREVFLSLAHPLEAAARIRVVAHARAATIDRTAAAWWHGLVRDVPGPITAAVPRSAKPNATCGVAADLKRRTYPHEDITEVRGIQVTGTALSVLGAASEHEEGLVFLDRMIQKRVVTVPELVAALDRNRGVHGLARVRKLLGVSADGSESEAERLFVRMLRSEQITGWKQQFPICGRPWDFAWPAERVGVEIHGYAFHRHEDRWNRDLAKANSIACLGWIPLAYSWKQLNLAPGDCMRELANALAARRAELL
ncbi:MULTISPECIES: hypothetical protein [Gordonia]|uniref:DUF559 domain-containing protein n=1 Tax=Gordonia sihwensis NBRC 108236 TaxID=1223544 RepID=L7LKP5_9ACTN|nr:MULTISPECIES: hypothetical protein [Gordonia]AUH67848.1 hypothetical protein CXX93_05220 [Gordonia sp. YC-JH1]GAC60662.1 hypothetical protein GSI01S_11_00030 [Gordonia sihwensis NBRC 108236]